MKRFLFFILLLYAGSRIQAQRGSLRVHLKDQGNNEDIPFANIVVYQNGKQLRVATTNMDGECKFDTLLAGRYDVKGVYVGYQAKDIKNVLIKENKTTDLTIALSTGEGVHLEEIEIVTYQVPLIDPDTKSGSTVTREEYQNMAMKSYNSVTPSSNGVFRSSSGQQGLTVRGARSGLFSHPKNGNKFSQNTTNASGLDDEKYEAPPENTFKSVSSDPLSTFSSDVDVASYANARRFLNQGTLPPKDAVRIEELINYFRYQYQAPINKEPFTINTELAPCVWNEKHQLLQIGIQGKSIEISSQLPNNLTFLIDVSGSMSDENKLPLLKSGLKLLVEQLREEDRVSIVVYAGNAGLVLPSTKGKYKEKIYEALENLQAGGSTAGGEGIELAYKIAKDNFVEKGNNRVILATDGDFNVGISDDNSLVKLIEEKRDQGIFLTVLGFGTGNYQDAKMEKLADKGNGNYAYVDNILEAKKVLVKELGGTLITIAKDVKLQIEFNPKFVREYRLIGYENRSLNNEDFNNDKKDAGDVGSGHSVTALYEIIPAGSSESEVSIDKLKYQKLEATDSSVLKEMATIKLRYKEPKENTSLLISKVVYGNAISIQQTSDNFRFCAAVAEFGMLLKQSQYKGNATFQKVIELAKGAKGKDEDGYRAEFIKLCETAELLAKN